MTEFQGLVKDAPKFASMERGELVAHAYAMYAAGAKTNDENEKLRELCADLLKGFECGWPSDVCGECERDGEGMPIGGCKLENRARELGVEVDDGTE